MAKQYQSKDIEVLEGLDPVRKRPGMYTDTERPNHLAHEVIDNSVDEALAGFAKHIDVTLYKDGSFEVQDDGRGMPVDKHPKEKMTGVELILTRLHAGGKFSDNNYQFAGGLHGVGVSVVNALSSRLEVWVQREGKVHHLRCEQGVVKQKLKVIGKVGKQKTGTRVRFWPEAKYFDTTKFALAKLKATLRAKAVLCSGLTITFGEEGKKERESWCFVNGVSEYLQSHLVGECLPNDAPFTLQTEKESNAIDCALCWAPDQTDALRESFVNLIPTAQGGTHVNGLRNGLTEALRSFCELRKLAAKNLRLLPDDVCGDLQYVLSYKTLDPQFSGQTKEKFASRDATSVVANEINDAFSIWLNTHAETGEALAAWVIARAEARVRAGKKVVRKKAAFGPSLPGKLADCTSQDLNKTEIFLVEGDSAGGSAKQARDKSFQAVMPLRGKILNTWEVGVDQVMGSKEVNDIAVALGVQPGSDDISNLRYGKVCILADADADGLHIATLLTALFVKHFRPLVEAKHIFVAEPPLFRVDIGKAVHYCGSEQERDVLLKKAQKKPSGKISVTRFKGLGEMNPGQLRETTMNPASRRLSCLAMESASQAQAMLDLLLAKKRSGDRRTWLENKGHLRSI